MILQERSHIVGIIAEQILGVRSAVGTAMAAMVEGKDLPAIQESRKQLAIILPAAGHAMEEEEGRTVRRADHAMEGESRQGEDALGERLHRRLIPVNRSRSNRLDRSGLLRMLHAEFTTQHNGRP